MLRTATARAVIAAGLHQIIGLFHADRGNSFALADNLIELFRPMVDCAVKGLVDSGVETVTPDAKRTRPRLSALDPSIGDTRSPLTTTLARLTLSLAQSFETGKPHLD